MPDLNLLTLSIGEAALETGLSERTLRYLVSSGRIPVTKVGRLVRFRVGDLRAYLDVNTRPAR